jgi:fatty acid desaturase
MKTVSHPQGPHPNPLPQAGEGAGMVPLSPSGGEGRGEGEALRGQEFREDLRPVSPAPSLPGSANTTARRWLSADELAPLTRLSNSRSLLALSLTVAWVATGIALTLYGAFGITANGPTTQAALSMLAGIVMTGVQLHGLFILAHEAAHYRLFTHRSTNDAVGRFIGMSTGISVCSYRVMHRLHHNHLYGAEDPDTAIHGGYPRGVAYLWKKLAGDLAGLNAWKTYAYFFGAPALNDDTQKAARPLDDTSPSLRREARRDRMGVVAWQVGLPVALTLLWGPWALALYALAWWLPMLTVLQPILRLRAICEHGAVFDLASPLTAARTTLTSGSLSGSALDVALNTLGRALLFPHHVNHHLEHHLYPAVPHYHLPALHAALRAKGALQGAEVRDLRETLAIVFAPRRSRLAAAT